MQGIEDNDPSPVVREKLAQLAAGLPVDLRDRALQVFEALFGFKSDGGVPLEGEAFRRELRAATETWWRARFASVPTMLVFDDMHWSDAASVALLRELLPLVGEMPLVLMCVLRTERQAPTTQP